jgi:uncharacterized alkaline shock family protein YloU
MEEPMNKPLSKNEIKLPTNELEFPDTIYVRDIENRVFQSLVMKAIESVQGISPLENNLIGNLLNMGQTENFKGIIIEQDSKKHSVSVKVELNISYGESIPEKAAQIQAKIAEEIVQFTGLHVSSVHVVFKNIASPPPKKAPGGQTPTLNEEFV